VTRNALKFVRDEERNDQQALLRQIETRNEIITILSQRLDPQDFERLKIAEDGAVLTHIYSKMNSIRSTGNQEVVCPVMPISESSLFTGSSYEPNMLVS
jgi:hypothetical protein